MNDIFELYHAFIEHISMLKIDKKNPNLISNISNTMEILQQINHEIEPNIENEKFFIEKMDNIYLTVKEKKNKVITDISSFPYFLKCLKLKPNDFSSFLNIYDLDCYNLNLPEIGTYLQNNNNDDYNVFFNHFLLIYLEICNHIYSDDKEMPKNTKLHYNMIIDKFTEDSFNSDKISDNVIELILLVVNIVLKNNMSEKKYTQILDLLNDENLPIVIEKIIKINMNETEIEESNEEIKKLSKSEITDKINFYMNKFNNIDISNLLQNIDLKNIMNGDMSSIMNLVSGDLFGNISDIMENFSPELLENLPVDPTELLQTFMSKK